MPAKRFYSLFSLKPSLRDGDLFEKWLSHSSKTMMTYNPKKTKDLISQKESPALCLRERADRGNTDNYFEAI